MDTADASHLGGNAADCVPGRLVRIRCPLALSPPCVLSAGSLRLTTRCVGRRQGTGHDTLYPSLDIVNEALGTREDLYRLAREAKAKYDTIISYHINTDEAYSNYSEYRRDASGKLSFVDGLQNSDVNERMLALNPDGTGYEWGPNHNQFAYDPLQGPAYHLSKTKDFVSGQRIKRLEKVFDTIPVDLSLHCDAWRDINLSYENTTEDDPWCVHLAARQH